MTSRLRETIRFLVKIHLFYISTFARATQLIPANRWAMLADKVTQPTPLSFAPKSPLYTLRQNWHISILAMESSLVWCQHHPVIISNSISIPSLHRSSVAKAIKITAKNTALSKQCSTSSLTPRWSHSGKHCWCSSARIQAFHGWPTIRNLSSYQNLPPPPQANFHRK